MSMKTLLLGIFFFACLLFAPSAKAQLPSQLELSCPSGTSPLPGGTTVDNITGKFLQNICVDVFGTIFHPGGIFSGELRIGLLNQTRWNCGVGGYRFGTIESGLADISANSTQGGFLWTCPDNATDLSVGQVEIGSSAKTAAIEFHPGNQWSDNIATFHTYSWGLHNGSALYGVNNGTIGTFRTGGAYLKYNANANTNYALSTVEGLSGQQASALFQHFTLEGCGVFGGPGTCTVGAGCPAIAMLNWEGISSMNTLEDATIFDYCNSVGVRLASNNVGGLNELLGPLVVKNVWSMGYNNTGAQPWKITTTSGSCAAILPISIVGGVGHGSGSSLPEFEINGQGCPRNTIRGGLVSGFYTENLNAGLSPIHYKIADVSNYSFIGTSAHVASANETLFDISQSGGAAGTCNLTMQNNFVDNNAATAVNNHISGFTMSGQGNVSFYHYGGDSNCNIFPVTIDSNTLMIVKKNQAAFFRNMLDSELDVDLDSGLTAAQNAAMRWCDRGNGTSGNGCQWKLLKDASQNYILNDVTNSLNRMVFFASGQGGQTEINNSAGSSNGVQINMRNSTGTAGLRIGNGAATALEVARIDGSGNIFFHCQTTTFQNCGELTGTFTGGASPRIITAPDAASVTPSFLNCGTTSTCAQTNTTRLIILNGGPIALAAGTLTITSLPFASSTSYVCSADDSTGINGIDVVYVSGSSVTFNGTGTDSIRYSCSGN